MYLMNSQGQQRIDDYYDYSGTITTGGTAQLLLPQRKSCSFLLIVNNSTANLVIQIGVQRAIANLTSGVVTSVTVNDVGFGFLDPPEVIFLGGGVANDPMTHGGTMPDWPPPYAVASGHANLSGGAITSITVDNGGSGYLVAPYVQVRARRTDPTGVGLASATAGVPLGSGQSYYVNGTFCPTTAISVFGANTGQAYTVKWAP